MLLFSIESSVPANLDSLFRAALEAKFTELSHRLYQKVIENLSGRVLKKESGQLAASIREEVDVSGDVMMAIVGPEPQTPKAWALEYGGSKNYAIFPSKANVLRFYWDKVGSVVFLPYVDHPPSKEYAYLRTALAEMEPIAAAEMRETAEQVLGG